MKSFLKMGLCPLTPLIHVLQFKKASLQNLLSILVRSVLLHYETGNRK